MDLKICGYCIQELEKTHPGLKKQLEASAHARGEKLSHGTCLNHSVETLRGHIPDDKIQAMVQKLAASRGAPVDLRQHPEMLQQYLQQPVTPALKERLQKLANIVKEIKNHASSSCH